MVVFTFFLVFAATIFAPDNTFTFPPTSRVITLFLSAFMVVAALISASLFLWIGMLHFLIVYDGRSAARKGLWFLIMLLGLSYGAAIYYWIVFRRFLPNTQEPLQANQKS